MREINVREISEKVARLCVEANYYLGEDVEASYHQAAEKEESPVGKEVLKQLIDNVNLAREQQVAMCQDTGLAVVFIEVGQEVRLTGGNLKDAINDGIRRGYEEGYLRKSAVKEPIWNRVNTGDNTPGIIHYDIVEGEKIKIKVAPKGGGAENMSALKMLKPSDGLQGVIDFVVEQVENAGPNPCPPTVLGVGVGGTFEKAAFLSKKALLRPLGEPHPQPNYANLEKEILQRVNSLGIGPQGFGGRVTTLAVHVEYYPTHIASLPVAVNFNCHASRHKEAVL